MYSVLGKSKQPATSSVEFWKIRRSLLHPPVRWRQEIFEVKKSSTSVSLHGVLSIFKRNFDLPRDAACAKTITDVTSRVPDSTLIHEILFPDWLITSHVISQRGATKETPQRKFQMKMCKTVCYTDKENIAKKGQCNYLQNIVIPNPGTDRISICMNEYIKHGYLTLIRKLHSPKGQCNCL